MQINFPVFSFLSVLSDKNSFIASQDQTTKVADKIVWNFNLKNNAMPMKNEMKDTSNFLSVHLYFSDFFMGSALQ